MDKKIIFFDIDGTLLDDNKKLPNSTKTSIQQLQENGHFVAIATGRPPFTFTDLREQLGITTYVSLNGQYVVHQDEVVYKHSLDYETLEKLVIYSSEQDHPLAFIDEQGWETNVKDHPHVTGSIDSLKVSEALTYNPESFKLNEKYQALLFCEKKEEEKYIDKFPSFRFVRWHDYSVDVLPKDGSKAVGIQRLLDILSINPRNAYAYGDGLNDLEMLEFVPNSVAMGNGLSEVKEAAKYITESVDQDGIQASLKRFELIK